MKIFKECSIIFSIAIFSNVLSSMFNLPIPGSVLGIFILFSMLYLGIIKERQIHKTADFFLKNMTFFFIPGTIAIIEDYKFLEGKATAFILISIFIASIVIASTALSAQALEKKKSRVK